MKLPRNRRLRGDKVLRPIWPSLGLAAAYRRKIDALIDDMHASVMYWVASSYRNNEPATIATDEAPVAELQKTMNRLARQWRKKFTETAARLAKHFAEDVTDRSDATLKKALKDGGFAVEFTMSAPMRDALNATIRANVQLIKSIPAKYLDEVQGAVMRSVQAGRDAGSLSKFIQKEYGVARRRAALIARDQNNKATAAMTRARRIDLDLTEAIWMHSHAGEVPRPSHVKMDGKKFDIRKGMYDKDEGRYVQPGELINCRCSSRPVVPGVAA